ncbi:VOC family protein [Furfurilactobacillus sp. WILCCON 0119]
MPKMIFVNLPVTDLARSISFYEALGFKRNPTFSSEFASTMVWDETIMFELLTPDFYKKFIGEKNIIDGKTTSGALISLSMDSADEVRAFANAAQANGGHYFHVDTGMPEEQMFGLEVVDPDGNQLEPTWMDVDMVN